MKNIVLVLGLSFSLSLYSQNKEVLQTLNQNNSEIDTSFLNQPSKYSGSYALKNQILNLAKSKYKGFEYMDFEKWFAGSFFYDMIDMLKTNFSGQYRNVRYFTGFDQQGDRPLEGYLAAKEFAKTFQLKDLNIKHIVQLQHNLLSRTSIKTHKLIVLALDKALRRNSEGIEDSQLGNIRNHGVGWRGGFENESFPRIVSHRSIFKNILRSKDDNPYVYYKDSSWTAYLNPGDHFNLTRCTQELKLSEEQCQRIQKNRNKYRENRIDQQMGEDMQDWLAAHVDEAISILKNDLSKVKINRDVVRAAANFHYRLVSIHTLSNGNGRTTRVLTEKILEDYNLPPPIHYPFGIDVTFSMQGFASVLSDAVALSKRFHEDLALYLQNGIPYGYVSSHFLAPGWMPFRLFKEIKLSPKEFMAYAMQFTNKDYMKNWKSTPTDIIKDFLSWRKKVDERDIKLMMIMTGLPKAYR